MNVIWAGAKKQEKNKHQNVNGQEAFPNGAWDEL